MFDGFFALPWWGHLLAALALTHVTIASVTIFLHRYQAHRALELGPLASHFFRFWLWLTTGMVTREWVAIHRKHHAKCDTAADPHSPQVLGLHRVLWGGVFLYVRESRNRETIERYGRGAPDDWLERRVYTSLHKIGILAMLGIDLLLFGALPGTLIWGAQMVWIPFWAAGVVNGLGHWWGYRNFACGDASTNLSPLGLLIGGEELHNNHHAYPGSARLSMRRYELDIGWIYIRVLGWLGQARVTRVAPRLRLIAARAVADADMLRAVVTFRQEVMARFLKSLRRVAVEELHRLQVAAPRRLARRLTSRDAAALAPAEREALSGLLARSPRLAAVHAMGGELRGFWERSSASREQAVKDFQGWLARAEASGIRQLQDFARRLRRYAVCPA